MWAPIITIELDRSSSAEDVLHVLRQVAKKNMILTTVLLTGRNWDRFWFKCLRAPFFTPL